MQTVFWLTSRYMGSTLAFRKLIVRCRKESEAVRAETRALRWSHHQTVRGGVRVNLQLIVQLCGASETLQGRRRPLVARYHYRLKEVLGRCWFRNSGPDLIFSTHHAILKCFIIWDFISPRTFLSLPSPQFGSALSDWSQTRPEDL